jgi:hypothetical protein
MCEYIKLKTEIWNLYVKRLEFENLKTEMSVFRCVNTESWKLKTENWNLFVKYLNTENWSLNSYSYNNWTLNPTTIEL